MAATMKDLGIGRLPPAERIALMHEIRESLAAEAADAPSEAMRREIDRRLAAHEADPGAAVPWEQADAAALARLRR